jgi:L-lactate dehydrogenase complex protein LldF
VQVHWARDAHEHNQIVYDILHSHGVERLVKSKSMLTEECDTRAFLGQRGIEVTETDLGERIQQLDDEPPSHIVGPAFQKTPQDIADLFHRVYGSDPDRPDPVYLAQVMREHTRPLILEAQAGMTGANFAVAETGAVVTVTNEGNADLSANVPKLRICSVGIEKVVPGVEQLAVFIRLLTRSATGERITQYTSHFAAPRTGGEMHIVLVDNGRSQRLADERFWASLKCIRCGACMNTCPVYRRSGGLSYGSTYMGPIGIIMMPSFDIHRHRELPYASTINGSCSNVCPVQINIHEQIYEWREVMDAKGEFSTTKKAAMTVADKVLSNPRVYRAAAETGGAALRVLPRFAIYNRLNAWGRRREIPGPVTETFHQWYARNRGGDQKAVDDERA